MTSSYPRFWESNLAGPNGYGLNSPPTLGSTCNRLITIMGFNYERTYDLMMHSFGHRVEFAMSQVYGGWQPDESTAWNRFSLLNKNLAGHAGCGNVRREPQRRKLFPAYFFVPLPFFSCCRLTSLQMRSLTTSTAAQRQFCGTAITGSRIQTFPSLQLLSAAADGAVRKKAGCG